MSKYFSHILLTLTLVFNLLFTSEVKAFKQDSLIHLLDNDISPNEKLNVLDLLIDHYKNVSIDSALLFSKQYEEIANKLGDPEFLAESDFNFTTVYGIDGNFQMLSKYAYPTLKKYKNLNDVVGQINVFSVLGRMHASKKEFQKAYETYEEAMVLAEKTNDYNSKVLINLGISNAKFLEQDINGAEQYLLKCIEDKENYTKKDSAELLAKIFNNLGNIRSTKEDDLAAIDYYKKSLGYYYKVNDKFGISLTAFNIGDVYNYNNQYDSALKYFHVTEEMGRQLHNYEELYYAYLGLSEVYERRGDFKNAFDYQNIKYAYSDSLKNQKYDRTVLELEGKYNAEKKAAQLKLKEKEIKASEKEKEEKQNVIIVLSIGGGVLIVLLIGLLVFYRRVVHVNKLIKEQSNSLDKALKQKEILLKEVHHRVKNNLQLIASLLNLQLMNLEDESAQLAIEESKARVQAIALMHKGLYQDENYNSVDLKPYVTELVDNQRTLSNSIERPIQFVLEIDEIKLNIDRSVPIGLILSELIGNSLKHAFNETTSGTITISIIKNEENILLNYKDDGVGLPEGFKIDEQDSLGFTVISALVEQINGKLKFNTYSPFDISLNFSEVEE